MNEKPEEKKTKRGPKPQDKAAKALFGMISALSEIPKEERVKVIRTISAYMEIDLTKGKEGA